MDRRQKAADIVSWLRGRGPVPSRELVDHFGISRATLSRRVRELGNAIEVIGRGRATYFAARHSAAPRPTPLYRVLESGQPERLGELVALEGGGNAHWLLRPDHCPEALLGDEFRDGLFPGWPWFLDDLRPSGFLGRAFARKMSEVLPVDSQPENWTDFELLTILSQYGSNLQGDLILGNGRALAEFQESAMRAADGRQPVVTAEAYPDLAHQAIRAGEDFGSSAGGEQPKFTTLVRDTPEEQPRAVIVKFSPPTDTPAGRCWADLLHAEHIAGTILREAGFDSAFTRVFERDRRVYLESQRFDRVGPAGRRGLVSLRALDAAFAGTGGGSWVQFALNLFAHSVISAEDRDTIVRLNCFGELIHNTDMHWGNLAFFVPDRAPWPLAPVYDMLPMGFRPHSSGEVSAPVFQPRPPVPEHRSAWLEMHPVALSYWDQVQCCPEISGEFQTIAAQAIEALKKIRRVCAGQ